MLHHTVWVGSSKACKGALWTPATVKFCNIFFDTTATD